jgi:hypothetical protein
MGSAWTAETWLRWVEPWYLAYALLGASAVGIVPILLPLAVHRSRGAAHVGWVIAANNPGGLTAPLWGILADRYRLHRCLMVSGGIIAAGGIGGLSINPCPGRMACAGVAARHRHDRSCHDCQPVCGGSASAGRMGGAHQLAPDVLWRGAGLGLLVAAVLAQMPLYAGLLAAAGVTALAALTAWFTCRRPWIGACAVRASRPLG